MKGGKNGGVGREGEVTTLVLCDGYVIMGRIGGGFRV